MGDLLADGVTWLGGVLAEHVAQAVAIAAGGVTLFPAVAATLGKSLWVSEETEGFGQQRETRDFIIRVALLGAQVPAISWTITLGTETYVVVQGPSGQPFTRADDPTAYRIHTVRKG